MNMWPFNQQQKALPPRTDEQTPQQPQVLYLAGGTAVAIVKWNESIAVEAALRHPIIHRAINKLAESVQQVKWFAEIDTDAPVADQRNKKGVVADLNALLANPHPDLTPAMIRYWIALNYACYGRVPIKVGTSAIGNKPNGIYPLEARYVFAKMNTRGIVDSFDYGSGEQKQTYNSLNTWKKAQVGSGFVDQIWKPAFKGYPHKDEVNTPLMSIGLPAQVIKSLLVRAINTAEGHPNVRYLVTCSKTLTKNQLNVLRDYLNEEHGADGPSAGRVPVLQNAADVEIHKLDNDLSDIHSKMPSDDMARMIFGAFGIPVALAGLNAADGSKFAGNYVESRLSFWQDTIIPGYLIPIFQGLTRMLCPSGVRISPDLDSIPALLAGRIVAMKELKDVDFLTMEEKREMFGWSGSGPSQTQQSNPTPPSEGDDNGDA